MYVQIVFEGTELYSFFNMKAFSVSVEVLHTHYVKKKRKPYKDGRQKKTKLSHKTIMTNTLFF